MRKTKKGKWFSITFPAISIPCLGLLLSIETSARLTMGLGDPVLYETSSVYGYRPLPNQNIRRFGNRIFFNAEGLRSEEISTNPVSGTIRVLCVGDSITYGGSQTDQVETYPYQLQELLKRDSSVAVEVLNASAMGWALENQEAYLRKQGIYNSKIVVLQLGTHDLFQPKSSSTIVGQSVSFPAKKPLFAIEEGFSRYFIPKFFPNWQVGTYKLEFAPTKEDVKHNIASFVRIANFIKSKKAKLVLILIEQPEELEPKDELVTFGKKLIADKAKKLNIPYMNLREDFRLAGGSKLFHDGLHPNPKGNRVIAKSVAKWVMSNSKTSNKEN